MKTKIITFDPQGDGSELAPAARALLQGETVVFPTETVYGLGAVWDDAEAVRNIFRIKGRPQDNPLIVHESSAERMKLYFAAWDEVAQVLTDAFCPGPFTLIMKKKKALQSPAAAGLDTIAVRIPSHKVPRKLVALCGKGLAAPSANISGRPSPTNARDAAEDLDGKVPYIIDGGSCDYGVESTIISWTNGRLELLRPGGISAERIEKTLQAHGLDVPLIKPSADKLRKEKITRAPGMKYRHYAPAADVHVISGKNTAEKLQLLASLYKQKAFPGKILFYISEELASEMQESLPELYKAAVSVITFPTEKSHQAAARGLFAAFRETDRLGASACFAEEQNEEAVGAAYMNRLLKAAAAKTYGPLPGSSEKHA